ncbi:MAG: hypothetical protein NTY98_17105 [Verrucomicrobia bacterium]|nr:hypothetical protein [Verrucomicrobiota bacterium]
MYGKELTLADLEKVARKLKWCVPALTDAYVIGSGAVAALHPELPGELRFSVDFDFVPQNLPILYFDSMLVDRFIGAESEFRDTELVYADYATPATVRCTPPGWKERAHQIILPEGLVLHVLAVCDAAYNPLYAGRPKDIVWVRGLLGTAGGASCGQSPRCGGPGKSGAQHGTSPGANRPVRWGWRQPALSALGMRVPGAR